MDDKRKTNFIEVNEMKASQLINTLQVMIDKYGDHDCVRDDYGDYLIEDVEYVSDKESTLVDSREIKSGPAFRLW